MDYEELKKKIETFSLDDGDLGSQGYERVLLQLFGYTGHGKSSFINSCMFVLNDGGPFVEYAEAEKNICGGSMTMIRKAYELTDNITIVDNRGLKNNFEGAEVYAQLGNFHPLNQTIQWKENFNDAISALEENELDTDVSDLLIPVFIYSAGNILEGQEEEDVKSFLKNCVSMTGLFPIIVITNKTGGNYTEVEEKCKLMEAEVIITIENYTKEDNQKTPGRNTEILAVINSALKNARSYLDQPRDPRKEKIERKKFLFQYIHEAMLNLEGEKAKREQKEDQRSKKDEEMKNFCILQ